MFLRVAKKRGGFSLIETLVASLIFIIATVGLFSVFTTQRQSTNKSERKLKAAYFARQVLEDLRAKVDQRNWSSGDLSVGNHTITSGPYTATYVVTEDATTKVRKVVLTVSWTEP